MADLKAKDFTFLIISFIFLISFISVMNSTTASCIPTDSGPVVTTTPLVSFLASFQETALKTFGHKDFDPKLYVDVSLKYDLTTTLEAFNRLSRSNNGSVSVSDLNGFMKEYLAGTDGDLVHAEPVDFLAEPREFLPKVENPEMRAWALEVHSLWKNLCRKVSDGVLERPDLHTLLPLKNPFIIPGSRFREVYYWDSYWVIRSALIWLLL